VAVSGVLIMGIVFGILVLVLVAAFLVYYCAFKPAKEDAAKTGTILVCFVRAGTLVFTRM